MIYFAQYIVVLIEIFRVRKNALCSDMIYRGTAKLGFIRNKKE